MPFITAKHIHIKGLVQGIGFRPFVYRLALKNNLCGWVLNGNDGVRIHAEGLKEDIDLFVRGLKEDAPEASIIQEILTEDIEVGNFTGFQIRKSHNSSDEITDISPDIAVCRECLEDMKSQAHRIDYPFINCTNCGPRFTIIRDLPYDRDKTTMEPFVMCSQCEKEYSDIRDRRFHAQPVACNHCGPYYEMICGTEKITGIESIIDKCASQIDDGKIIGIKGMGGFHIACDATREETVGLLRLRKNREGKPFAVMFGRIETARDFLDIDPVEEKELLSWRRPVVILKNKRNGSQLSESVSNGFHTTGVMLPYMPFHYLLFERLKTPAIVLTSGNLSDEPIIIDNQKAGEELNRVTEAIVIYNRDIYNRTDDSVVMAIAGESRIIRRSRGYVPSPVNLKLDAEGIFAAGAELVNCFAVGKGNQAILSQHIGDLKNLETLDFYAESFQRFQRMLRVKPSLVACDMHPDYLSTRFAREFALTAGNLPVVKIQHHHAHIASCMAENGIDEPVIGISLDGVGLGTDGNIWGFEVMIADLLKFERISHLDYIPQPGGDQATHEPWRMALAYIYKYIGPDVDLDPFPFYRTVGKDKIEGIKSVLDKKINCPMTSSAGRLFDAVAAMTGLCTHSAFHAEAPMRLEDSIKQSIQDSYFIHVDKIIDPSQMIISIHKDILHGTDPAVISAKFHHGMVRSIIESAIFGRDKSGLNKVLLSGGVFQNRFLLSNSIEGLKKNNFKVYTQSRFPSNDGGIALGQLAIAAMRRKNNYPEFSFNH